MQDFYQSKIDCDNLKAGENYSSLPDTVLIFLCTFDPFGGGLAKYTQRPMLIAYGDEFEMNNGTTVYYLNSKYFSCNVDSELKHVLDYMEDAYDAIDPAGITIADKIAGAVANTRSSATVRRNFMSLEEMLRRERDEGRKQGRAQTLEEIASALGCTVDDLLHKMQTGVHGGAGVNKLKL